MIPVLIGTALALIALGYVLYPLFREELAPTRPIAPNRLPKGKSSTAIEALREIEFDHATGKLSDSDYLQLKNAYTQRAIADMRAGTTDTSANTIICPTCGPRAEANAAFCSECGRALAL
jgi:hypothetical protein